MPGRGMIAINKKAHKVDRSPLVCPWQIFAENGIAFLYITPSRVIEKFYLSIELKQAYYKSCNAGPSKTNRVFPIPH